MGEYELIEEYQKQGIASYPFFYGLAFTLPTLIMLLKQHKTDAKRGLMILFLLLIIIISIVLAQMTTAFLFSLIGIIFSLLSSKSHKKSLRTFVLVLLLLIMVPNQFYADLVSSLSKIVPQNTVIHSRLTDLSLSILFSDEGIISKDTHTFRRAERIPVLLENFYKSPLIGGGKSSAHNFWLDRLSLFGLIGIIPWIVLYYIIINFTIQFISENISIIYFLSIILFIGHGFIKGASGKLLYIGILFLVPSILIIYSSGKTLFTRQDEKRRIAING